ncbi:MAG: InlB B-repeat-containing protein [Lachnospiraceae bacterium]|nr:InlB B-repeat-containing protein [Lachnospiraceae bacterium]
MRKKIFALFTMMLFLVVAGGVNAKAAGNTLTVVYNSNGGSGTMANSTVDDSETLTLTANAFTKSGAYFTGWNTAANGSGTSYANKGTISGSLASSADKTVTLYAQWKYYKATIVYYKNGGKGSMSKQKVNSGTTFKLKANKFKKSGYVFGGWNTTKTGSGKSYANKADGTALAAGLTKNTTIKLYAQWKLKAPTLKKVSVSKGTNLVIKWKKTSKAAGYQIQYSTSKKFTKSTTESVTAKKSATSKTVTVSKTNKTYYVRIRNYYKNGSTKIYSDWSNVIKKKVPKVQTIENQKSKLFVISAKMKLSGSGTGYHGKLLLTNGTAAVSFGLQYDTMCGKSEYRSKAAYLCENITNAAVGSGGQSYTWFGSGKVKEWYTVMMTLDKSTGKVKCYIDGTLVGSVTNSGLKSGGTIYAGLEGSARVNGDKVNVQFKEIKMKTKGSSYDSSSAPGCNMVTNQSGGIKAYYKAKSSSKTKAMGAWTPTSVKTIVIIKGTLSGVPGDWDSDYDKCSSVVHYPLG